VRGFKILEIFISRVSGRKTKAGLSLYENNNLSCEIWFNSLTPAEPQNSDKIQGINNSHRLASTRPDIIFHPSSCGGELFNFFCFSAASASLYARSTEFLVESVGEGLCKKKFLKILPQIGGKGW
jgi:hypothetical protein